MVSRLLFALIFVLIAARGALAQDLLAAGLENELTIERVLSEVDGVTGPVAAEFLPDGRMVILLFDGRILLYNGTDTPTAAGTIQVQTDFERGLLGLAVDPMFTTTRRLYFYYSQADTQRLAYTTLDANTQQVDTANLQVILEGMGGTANHNGGGLRFGPDGLLYIGVGDTGCNSARPPGDNPSNYFGTCLSNLHGKILRVDRDGNVPASNPLVGAGLVADCFSETCPGSTTPTQTGTARTEIYLWGLRNPWRFTFDSLTGYLWIADVGEETFEEITLSATGGQHHGWPLREGFEGQARARCAEITPQSGDCVDPIFSYPHSEAPARGQASITGGVFAHHCSWPDRWRDKYWFGDFNKNRVWTLSPNPARDGVDGERELVVESAAGPVHFVMGPDGAIYYLNIGASDIQRIRPVTPRECTGEDASVSDTGAADARDPDAGHRDGMTFDGLVGFDEAGVPPDSGLVRDAGTGPADSGSARDGGDGCGCHSQRGASNHPTGWGAGWAMALFALLRGRRRLASRRESATLRSC